MQEWTVQRNQQLFVSPPLGSHRRLMLPCLHHVGHHVSGVMVPVVYWERRCRFITPLPWHLHDGQTACAVQRIMENSWTSYLTEEWTITQTWSLCYIAFSISIFILTTFAPCAATSCVVVPNVNFLYVGSIKLNLILSPCWAAAPFPLPLNIIFNSCVCVCEREWDFWPEEEKWVRDDNASYLCSFPLTHTPFTCTGLRQHMHAPPCNLCPLTLRSGEGTRIKSSLKFFMQELRPPQNKPR